MKSISKYIVILLAVLVSCGQPTEQKSEGQESMEQEEVSSDNEFPNGVCYEIFVQSFADGDGDGIGDFKGATAKLDYLQDLGIRAVWLMPIMESPSYHKYDVTDYKSIHPDYGTEEDFKTFVAEAHKRNIKVIIDMIINHSSSEHPWFKEASTNPDSPYREYYVWANKDSIADQISKKEVTHDSDNITQWHAVNGDTLSEHYYGFFYGGMPDLNYDSDRLKQEIVDIGKWWLTEMDVDGFRLDAAKHIFAYERMDENHQWWAYYRDEMRKVKPDVYIVGEVWDSSDLVVKFVNGLPAMFNFDLAGSINQTVISGNSVASTIEGHGWKELTGKTMVDVFLENTNKYKATNPDFTDAIFLTNHDQNRVMSNLGGDLKKAKLAASILLTLPGTPYIYYGEEIGMLGMKPDEYIREPFLWKEGEDEDRASWVAPRYSTDAVVVPLVEQIADANSLYNHYRSLIHQRNGSNILLKGKLESISMDDSGILVYKRVLGNKELSIYHNLTEREVSIEGYAIKPYETLVL